MRKNFKENIFVIGLLVVFVVWITLILIGVPVSLYVAGNLVWNFTVIFIGVIFIVTALIGIIGLIWWGW